MNKTKLGLSPQKIVYQLNVAPLPAHSLEAGLEVKYLIMLLCMIGIRQQHRTTAFTAMIPENIVHKL